MTEWPVERKVRLLLQTLTQQLVSNPAVMPHQHVLRQERMVRA